MEKELQQQSTEAEVPKQSPTKTVELSQFNRYREAYLRERLRAMNVKDDAETDAAIKFINDHVDETDNNLDEVFNDLKVRMRLEQRLPYVDPSPMNGERWRPAPVDGRQIGAEWVKKLKEKGRIR